MCYSRPMPKQPTSKSIKNTPTVAPITYAQPPAIVLLDPGHGGASNPGATGNGIVEARKVLQLTTAARFELMKDPSLRPYQTRDTDWHPSFAERAKRAKDLRADIVISVHINASSNTDARGLWLFHGHGQTMARDICAEIAANHVPGHFKSAATRVFDAYDNPKVDGDEWLARPEHVLERYAVPAILIEYGFLSNEFEAGYLRSASAVTDFAALVSDVVASFRRLRGGVG